MTDLPLKNAEYWVMRIHGRADDPALLKRLYRELMDGKLAVVNKDIVEPLSCHEDAETAMIEAQTVTGRTGQPCKVVLNAEL